MASKKKYHITYQKVESYTMEDDDYTDVESWFKDVCANYKTIGKRQISSNHSGLLKAALEKRLKNKNKSNEKLGYRIFDKIIGEYLVNIEDRKVVDDRLKILGEFLDIINKDESLTTKDPQPNKKGDSISNRSGVKDELAIKEAALVMTYKLNKLAPFGAVMGYITSNFADLDPKSIAKKLGKQLSEENEQLKGKDKKTLLKMIKLEFPDARVEEEGKEKKDTSKKENISYYFGAGVYEPTDVFYELSSGEENSIPIRDIIKRMNYDKKAQKRLNQIKPGASLWPVSATGNYYLVISNDPVLVATKSTGRTWASTSCENYKGAYHRGPYSDIEHGNAIVYIFDANKPSTGWPNKFDKTLKGRTLLRWGHRDDAQGVYDIGVEKRVYPSNKVWGLQIATAIGLILKDSGFLKYKTRCRTPYVYRGWADTMGKNGVRINYTKLIMEGQTVDLDQAIFGPEMELAGSPTISYSDCNRLSRQNVDIRIRRELAQNATIWNQEMALGRLIRSRDAMVCNLLAASPLAHPAALAAMAENIADIDPEDYRNPLKTGSLIFNIAKNPNSNLDVYDTIVKNHPGFIDAQGNDIGSAEEILYLGLLNRNQFNNYNMDLGISLAPAERLDQLIDEYVSYKGSKGKKNRIKTRVTYANNQGIITYGNVGAKYTVADCKALEMVTMISKLIFSPHLQESQYYKLLNLSKKIKSSNKAMNEVLNAKLADIWSKAFLLDLSSPESWGFNSEVKINLADKYKSTISHIPEELKIEYSNFDRQCVEVYEFINAIGGNNVESENISDWVNLMLDVNSILNQGFIRDEKCFEYLWRRRAKFEIDTISFCNKTRSSVDELKSGKLIIDSRRLSIAFEELEGEELIAFRWDFLPTQGRDLREIRKEVSSDLVNNILKKGTSEIRKVGFDTVSNWLMYPKQFSLFSDITLHCAIGDYYSVKDNTLIPPYSEDELFANPSLIEKHENNLQYIKILNDAANGIQGEGGLCRNPRIPQKLQLILIKTWKDISSQYDGFYHEDYYNILEALCKNENTSSQILNDLYLENRKLHQDISTNPNTPQKLLLYLYKEYPSEVLSNISLDEANFTRLWYMTMDVLRTEVQVDVDRLNNLFLNCLQDLQTPVSGVKRREYYRNLLRDNSNWISYWRGGRVKAGSYSEFAELNMWEDGGLADLPIPIRKKKFVMVNTPNRKKHCYQKTEIYFINSMEGKKDDLKIDGKVIKYNSDNGVWEESKIDNRKKHTAENFFNFVSPAKRGGEVKIYYWDYSKFKTKDYDEMVGHIERYNENNDTEYSPEEYINEAMQEADKWNIDNIFVFTDSKPPKGEKKVPVWRYSWDKDAMSKIINAFLQRKNYKETKVLMKDWASKYMVQGSNISKERQAELSLYSIYEIIDSQKLWTKELIDNALPDLLYNKGEIFLKLNNVPLTKKLLTSTLCESDEELEEHGISNLVTLHDLSNIKKKILTYPIVPIPYVYHILETTIQQDIVNMAKNIRNNRPREYNQYLLENTPDHPEE